MKTKQLNRTDLNEFVFIDDDKFELWRSSLSADKASIKNLYADSLSCATFAFSSTSAENIQAVDISAENISADTGNIRRLNANEFNVTSVDGAVSSQTHIGLNDVYLYSGSDISGGDGLPEAYGFFSAAATSSDVWLSMSKLALNGKRQKLSVQTEGFSVLNEQLTTDNQVEESSYVELAFPDDLSGQHTLATRHDISSALSGYIEKNDGNLDLNDISCQSILVSAETEADTEHIRHHSEIAVKTPRSNAYVASIYTEQEDGSRESDSRFLASNNGDIGGRDVFYFATGRFVGESQDPQKAGISVDAGYGYALAQTKDVQLGPDEEQLNTEKRTRIDFVGDGNPSITASENIIKNQEITVSDRRLKIEVPLSDREGDQVMALRSDLSDYSYGKDELDQKLRPAANLSNICETIFDFGCGDVSAFGWTGLMTSGMLQQAGLKSDYGAWEKQPVFVRIGGLVSAVGDYTFQNCISLQSIDLANINGVGKYAFDNCAGIQAITLSPSINAIGQDAFRNTGLTCIKIEGKTQAEAERLLERAGLPEGCEIETWDFQPTGEYVQQSSLTGFATDGDGRNYGIRLSSDGEAYVHVPWEQKDPPDTYKTYGDTVTALTSESGFKTYAQTSAQLSNDGYAIQAWVQEQNYISSVPDDYKTYDATVSSLSNNGYALSSDVSAYLALKQDKLTDPQISAIDSIVDERQTIIKYRDGSISSYDIIGTIDINDYLRDNTKYVTDIKIGNAISSIESTLPSIIGIGILSNVIIPDSVVNIGKYAFAGKLGLSGINIPNSVTSIGDSAFYNAGIVSILIPDGVEISPGIFVGCRNLTSIVFPNNLKTIADHMFNGCASLSSITIPDSVENIEKYAFKGCTNLRSVTIPNSVKKIDSFAFADCTNLLSVIIPSSVENINYFAFENCNNISIIFKDYYDKPLPTGFPWSAINAVSSIWNTASQEWVNENFSRIEVVNTLPASPDPTKFYFVTT